jgi:hypothetical protein
MSGEECKKERSWDVEVDDDDAIEGGVRKGEREEGRRKVEVKIEGEKWKVQKLGAGRKMNARV